MMRIDRLRGELNGSISERADVPGHRSDPSRRRRRRRSRGFLSRLLGGARAAHGTASVDAGPARSQMIREWQARAELEERATAAELAAMRTRRTRQGDAPPRSDRLLRGCLITVLAFLAAVAGLPLLVYAYTGTPLPF